MILASIYEGVSDLVNSVDEYSDIHVQFNDFQSADTSRQNGGVLSCRSHMFNLIRRGTCSKQVADQPAGNTGTDTPRLTQFQATHFQIYAILRTKRLK
jgi:hypothetical protein